jgi:hypothetical protein
MRRRVLPLVILLALSAPATAQDDAALLRALASEEAEGYEDALAAWEALEPARQIALLRHALHGEDDGLAMIAARALGPEHLSWSEIRRQMALLVRDPARLLTYRRPEWAPGDWFGLGGPELVGLFQRAVDDPDFVCDPDAWQHVHRVASPAHVPALVPLLDRARGGIYDEIVGLLGLLASYDGGDRQRALLTRAFLHAVARGQAEAENTRSSKLADVEVALESADGGLPASFVTLVEAQGVASIHWLRRWAGELQPGPRDVPLLMRLVHGEDVYLPFWALRHLARIGTPEARAFLDEVVEGGRGTGVLAAAALHEAGDSRHWRALQADEGKRGAALRVAWCVDPNWALEAWLAEPSDVLEPSSRYALSRYEGIDVRRADLHWLAEYMQRAKVSVLERARFFTQIDSWRLTVDLAEQMAVGLCEVSDEDLQILDLDRVRGLIEANVPAEQRALFEARIAEMDWLDHRSTRSEPSVFLASNPAETFTLEGRGFTPVGQRANVRLTAVSGTPFRIIGAWSATLDLEGVILSDTQVSCTMPGTVVSESTIAHVEVFHPSGWVTAELGPELTFWFQTKIVPDDGEAGDRFGSHVALEGDTAVLAARHTDDKAPGAGSAYVFVRSGMTWTRQQELTASDGAVFDEFGTDVSISGSSVVVGASQVDAAYVFVRSGTTWTQQQKLTPSDGGASAFGWSVAISGDTIVVGAPLDDAPETHAGSAYVFTRDGTTWTEQQKLLAPGGAFRDMFGTDVAVLDDTALIGAMGDSQEADSAGAAHVFVRSGTTWTPQAKLLAPDAAEDDAFGHSVALALDLAVVGASKGDGAVDDSGAAYVFTRSGTTWSHQQKLFSTVGGTLWRFGQAVAIWANKIVVGAPSDDLTPFSPGAAYVFARNLNAWKQQQRLSPSDGAANDGFGSSVAIDAGHALVGCPYHNAYGGESGAAYAD